MILQKIKNVSIYLSLLLFMVACTSSNQIKKEIVGRYSSEGENEYDRFKDTLEIRALDDEKFDIQKVAKWSSAKKDDPQRPNKNKKAGVWNSYGSSDSEVASLQVSDMTLRITEPLTGTVQIIAIDVENKTLKSTFHDGSTKIYHKVP